MFDNFAAIKFKKCAVTWPVSLFENFAAVKFDICAVILGPLKKVLTNFRVIIS